MTQPPATAALTEARIAKLPVTGNRYTITDANGSGIAVRVSVAGSKTFIVRRRVNGQDRRITLGQWPGMTLADARKAARAAHVSVDRGVDPVEQKRQRRRDAERADLTVGLAVTQYVDDGERGVGLGRSKPLRPKTVAGYRHTQNRALGKLSNVPLHELSGRHIDRLTRDLPQSVAAAGVRLLRAACNYAAARDLIDISPLASKRRLIKTAKPRTRHVAYHDLGRFMAALDDLQDDGVPAGEQVAGDALWMMLAYGLRSGEARRLLVNDVDLGKGIITVRAEETKNGDELRLPITPLVRRILSRRLALAQSLDSPWLFPSIGTRTSGRGHMAEPRHAIRSVTTATGIEFSPHDLRRTFASVAAKRVPHAALKSMLNHRASTSADITLAYVQVSVDDLREPMRALHDELLGLLAAARGMKVAATAGHVATA